MTVTARENIERGLYHLKLLRYVTILEEKPDRVEARYQPEFAAYVRANFKQDPGQPDQKAHPGYTESWREPGAVIPCMQVCLGKEDKADIDFDIAAPLGGDVASLVCHGAECLWHLVSGRKSDQKRISKLLDRRFRTA